MTRPTLLAVEKCHRTLHRSRESRLSLATSGPPANENKLEFACETESQVGPLRGKHSVEVLRRCIDGEIVAGRIKVC